MVDVTPLIGFVGMTAAFLYVMRQWNIKIDECRELQMENARLKGSLRMIRDLNTDSTLFVNPDCDWVTSAATSEHNNQKGTE